ncbi:circadian clock-controlled protein daywake-like [Ischnura elegans]|uniref:circadian clock-controlled protein daywake-like n=1 Tax=Ischnura elegans TaxID=197161 RepID=UPI001ED896E6|nr:circadian clock-controlled protein daywake-like [Ischnura elegans]
MVAKTALIMAVLFCICANSMDAAKPLPSVFKPCPKNDPTLNECAVANGNLAVPQLKMGIPSYGVPPLDPYFTGKKIDIEGKDMGVHFLVSDVNLHGLSNSEVKSISIKHDPTNFLLSVYIPVMQMSGKYEATGKVLTMPIMGEGDFNMTLYGVDVQYEFSCDTVEKSDGELYYAPTTNKVEYSAKNLNVQFENLFNGNKLLGDEMNRFINENWRELNESVGPKIAESIVDSVKEIIIAITRQVPVKDFWT